MERRAGVTLIEVLIAIFVTAIGLLALLVLFPVGALNMAQAIKDDQTGHTAADANVIASPNVWDIRHDCTQPPWPTPGATYQPFWTINPTTSAYQNPKAWGCTLAGLPANPLTFGPSFPVFVDPIGCQSLISLTTGRPIPLGGSNSPIPRVSTRVVNDPSVNPALGNPFNAANQNQEITRWFTFLDNLSFDANGAPDLIAGTSTITRDTRYSVAYLCRMPQVTTPLAVELTVLVYNKRAVQTDVVSGDPLGEVFYGAPTGYAVDFTTGPNVVTIAWASGVPAPTVKPGSWIMDATYITSATGVTPPTGYCYRVINVSESYTVSNPFPGQAIDLELQTNRRPPAPPAGATQPQNAVILLDDVAEVFELGVGS